jgi:hypothetical protein
MKIYGIYRYAALVLGLIYGAFFFLMALDSPMVWRAKEIGGLLIHASPAIVILLGSVLGFKKPLFGVILFVLITILTTLFFHTYRNISNFMVISFPALLVALLFLVCIQPDRKN